VLPPEIRRRARLTALFASLLFTCMWLPNPILESYPVVLLGPASALDVARATGPLSLGVSSIIAAFVLVELIALAVPVLRRRRLTDPGLRRRLWIAAVAVGFAWSFLRGLGAAYWMESAVFYDQGLGASASWAAIGPGWAFRALHALLLTAGTGIYFLAAWLIDRFGIGRGLAVAILVEILAGVPAMLMDAAGAFETGQASLLGLAVQAGAIAALALGIRWFFRLGDRLAEGRPFTVPACGTFPLEGALLVSALPAVLASFFYGDWLIAAANALAPGGTGHLALSLALVAALTFPAAAMFHWRRRATLASGSSRGPWLLARLYSAAFLAGLVITWHLALSWLPAGGAISIPDAATVLLAVALAWDWLHEVEAHRGAPGALVVTGEFHDVGDALEALRGQRLRLPGATAALTGLRFRSLTYLFGPYAPMRLLAGPAGGSGPAQVPESVCEPVCACLKNDVGL
jgi:hypothetical protein